MKCPSMLMLEDPRSIFSNSYSTKSTASLNLWKFYIFLHPSKMYTIIIPERGGEQAEPCDTKFSKKCLCSHYNNTTLIQPISLFDTVNSQNKYIKFQFQTKQKIVFDRWLGQNRGKKYFVYSVHFSCINQKEQRTFAPTNYELYLKVGMVELSRDGFFR